MCLTLAFGDTDSFTRGSCEDSVSNSLQSHLPEYLLQQDTDIILLLNLLEDVRYLQLLESADHLNILISKDLPSFVFQPDSILNSQLTNDATGTNTCLLQTVNNINPSI